VCPWFLIYVNVALFVPQLSDAQLVGVVEPEDAISTEGFSTRFGPDIVVVTVEDEVDAVEVAVVAVVVVDVAGIVVVVVVGIVVVDVVGRVVTDVVAAVVVVD